VHGPFLSIGKADPAKENSVLRCFFCLPVVQGSLVASTCSALAGLARRLPPRLSVAGTVAPVASLAFGFEQLKGDAIELSLERCVSISTAAIAEQKPHVVSGMSWGGAVVHLLVHRGLWNGPIVLLAPAAATLASHLRSDSTMRRILETPLPAATRGVVVHGDADDIVPLLHARRLVEGAPLMKLRVVAGDDHSLSLARPLVRSILMAQPHRHHTVR